jgi:acyl-CoA reductase-like NAD-dependent aldehyde dehydrogenase
MIPIPTTEPKRRMAAADHIMIDAMRRAQQKWAETPIRFRLRILKTARQSLATQAEAFANTVPAEIPGALHRSQADTLGAEVLPVLEALRYLEREAAWILRPQRMSSASRPLALTGVSTEVLRVPLGVVLIIAVANYPLLLAGVQAVQALAAGNAVLWKPARGGEAVADFLRDALVKAGLHPDLLTVLDSSNEAATRAIRVGVDKVFLTGSANTGRAVMRELAETLTPSVMELSGCDAVFVLDGADVARAVAAITFGMRLNGSATCMAPRRLFVTRTVSNELVPRLAASLEKIAPVALPPATVQLLNELISEAVEMGATVLLDGRRAEGPAAPTLISGVRAEMRIAQADIFAPVLSVIEAESEDEALAAYAVCPYQLSASVFGEEKQAAEFAKRLKAGNLLVNDVIVSSVDPRASFGGRGQSGFGVTRGREGLLEMTAVKTLQIQRSRNTIAYQPTTLEHAAFFVGYIMASHGSGWRQKSMGICKLFSAAPKVMRSSGR